MKTTIDHGEIKEWVDRYHGKPQILDHEGALADAIGLRIGFSNSTNFLGETNTPQDIAWEEFFRRFEEQQLAFEYNDTNEVFDPSLAYRFIKREETV